MRQNEADGVGLRERQHGNIHFHGGAVGGVDVKSALWGQQQAACTISQECLIKHAARGAFVGRKLRENL